MQQFILYFWQICLMRNSPDRAPSAALFLGLVTTIYVVVSTLSICFTRSDLALVTAFAMVVIGLAVQTGCVWLLLLYKQFPGRFRRTLVSLLGANSIMVVLLLPFNLVPLFSDNETLRLFSETSYWIGFGWWLAIAGYVYNRALDISIIQGSAIAFLVEVLSVWGSLLIQPAP